MSMGSRRAAREIAVQILYQMDVNGVSANQAIAFFVHLMEGEKEMVPFAEELVRGVEEHLDEIDELIRKHSSNWRLDRMAWVDRNVMRLGVYELLYRPDTPPKVVLNEAVDLGKKFGTDDSGSFINGILDSVHHQLDSEKSKHSGGKA